MKYLLLIFALLAAGSSNPAAPALVPESMQHCPENYHAMEQHDKAANDKIYQEKLAEAKKPENIAAYQKKINVLVFDHTAIKIKDLVAIIAAYVGKQTVLWGCTLEQAVQRIQDDQVCLLGAQLQGIVDPSGLANRSYDAVSLSKNPLQITRANALDFTIQPTEHSFLILDGCGLSGLVDNWLGNQPYVKRLDLCDNQFTRVPSGLAWSGPLLLTMIVLSHNRIPNVSYKDFETVPYLERLFLDDNLLTSFPTDDMWQLKHLSCVSVEDNPFTGSVSPKEQAKLIAKKFWNRVLPQG